MRSARDPRRLVGPLRRGATRAADNELTAAEKARGTVLLFDGHDAPGWVVKGGKPLPSTNVEAGSIYPFKCGGGLVYTKGAVRKLRAECDFKVSPGCNSGIFFRVGDPQGRGADRVRNPGVRLLRTAVARQTRLRRAVRRPRPEEEREQAGGRVEPHRDHG